MERIVLASASPRRQGFFKLLGLPFDCTPAAIDETPAAGLSPREAAEDIARRKAGAVAERAEAARANTDSLGASALAGARWIFAADTIVVLDGEIFGTPGSEEEARVMLGRLAGRKHEVITAMALIDLRAEKTDCRSVACAVEFAELSSREIEWYLATGEWQGAAGGYRLQEKGGCLVKAVTGSPSAVAGLPLREFYVMLRDNGYRLEA